MDFKKAGLINTSQFHVTKGNFIDLALYLVRNVARNAFQNALFKQPFYSQSVLQLCAGFAMEAFHVQPQIVLLILLFL